jgi:predicted SAM-dependent methyltransferase
MRKLPLLKFPIDLDVGCADKQLKNHIGMDIRDCGQEIVWDARHGIPFPDNSINSVFSSHFLEHLSDDEAREFLQDCLRVVRPGGAVCIRVPHATTTGAIMWQHKSLWNEEKVEGISKLEEPIGKFVLLENKMWEGQLLFTLRKI